MKAKPLLSITILMTFILSACQTGPQTTQPAAGTQSPGSAGITTPLPLASPASSKPKDSPTPTVPPMPAHLQVNPEKLRGLTIEFWHPWNGNAAQTFADLVYEFNTTNLWGIYVDPVAAGGAGSLYEGVNARLMRPGNNSRKLSPLPLSSSSPGTRKKISSSILILTFTQPSMASPATSSMISSPFSGSRIR